MRTRDAWDRGRGQLDKQTTPAQIFEEYRQGVRFKNALGKRGLYEQNRINERFYAGDQWYGARCSEDRPLVRHNVIRRIGDYKMAMVGAAPVAVSYSAEGLPYTAADQERVEALRRERAGGRAEGTAPLTDTEETGLVMAALSDYFRVTAERVNFDELRESALRNAYCSGSGIVYTYWDERIPTGQYADLSRRVPVRGDIACQVLDIENVYFGDPYLEELQEQPYILIAQRKPLEEVRRQIRRAYGNTAKARQYMEQVRADQDVAYMAGNSYAGGGEENGGGKTTILTRLWKEWDEAGESYTIRGIQVCGGTGGDGGVVVRPAWDLGIRLYPLAKFDWDRRQNCAYGDSEIPYLIPNQIAINRMLTASVWAVMTMGMPIMVVNGDIVTGPVTNDPGQVIQVFGGDEDVERAIRYVNPPAFSPQFDQITASLIDNTLSQAGATSAALGEVRPDNTSAIIALREAAALPLQTVQNRYYRFCEDIARIWAEFWVNLYGKRRLRVEADGGVWYMPFDAARFRDLLIRVRVDVGASSLWNEVQSVQTLDNLFDRQIIDVVQYLTRLPKGTVPNIGGLIRELEKKPAPGRDEAADA